jgi:hypothetical protein
MEGLRRLDDPKVFVRIELNSALKRDIRVIPVPIDGALMPLKRIAGVAKADRTSQCCPDVCRTA